MYPSHFAIITLVTTTLFTLATKVSNLTQVPALTHEDLSAAMREKPTLIVLDTSAMPLDVDAAKRLVQSLQKGSADVHISIIHHGPLSDLGDLQDIKEVTLVAEKGRVLRPPFFTKPVYKHLPFGLLKPQLDNLLKDYPGSEILEHNAYYDCIQIQYQADLGQRAQQVKLTSFEKALGKLATDNGYTLYHDTTPRIFQMRDIYATNLYVEQELEKKKVKSAISLCGSFNEDVHRVMNERGFTSVLITNWLLALTDAKFHKRSPEDLLDLLDVQDIERMGQDLGKMLNEASDEQ